MTKLKFISSHLFLLYKTPFYSIQLEQNSNFSNMASQCQEWARTGIQFNSKRFALAFGDANDGNSLVKVGKITQQLKTQHKYITYPMMMVMAMLMTIDIMTMCESDQKSQRQQ